MWLSPCSVQSSQIQGGSVDLISDAGRVGAKAMPHGHCAPTCLICWLSHLSRATSSRLGCIRAQDATARWTPGDIFPPTALTLRFPLVPVTSEHSPPNTCLPDVIPLPFGRAEHTVFLPGSLSVHLNRQLLDHHQSTVPQPGPGPSVPASHQPDAERQQRGSPTLCGQQSA